MHADKKHLSSVFICVYLRFPLLLCAPRRQRLRLACQWHGRFLSTSRFNFRQ